MSPLLKRSIRIFLVSFIVFSIFSSILRVSPVLAIILLVVVVIFPMVYVYFVYQHGLLLMMRGKTQEAIAHFTRVLNMRLPANRAFLWSRLAALKHATGDAAGAIDAYSQAIKLVPNDPSLYAVRSALYIAERDYGQALSDADRLLNIKPDSEVAFGNRANANIYLGNFDQAIEDCNQGLAVKNTPVGEALLYNNRGTAQRMKGNYTTALSDYNMAMSITLPEAGQKLVHPSVRTNQGIIYALQGDYDQARVFFKLALKQHPDFARAQAALAAIYQLLGDTATALREWQPLLDRSDKYSNIEHVLSEFQFPSSMADAVRHMLATGLAG